MNFDDNIPIYYQIKTYIYRQIITNKLKPGEKIPSVRQLAVDLTVNVNTIQRALSELLMENIIESKRGKGNFVTEDISNIKKLKDELITDQLRKMYDNLQKLNVSDQEILIHVNKYINEQEHNHNDQFN